MLLRCLILFSCLTLGLFGQAESIFRTYGFGAPPTFDPHVRNEPWLFRIQAQLYEAPLEMAVDGRGRAYVKGGVFRRPAHLDAGQRLVFRVTEGVRFHPDPCFEREDGSGREVTGEDLAYLFRRHADPKTASPFFAPFLAGRIVGLDAWRERAIRDGFADHDAAIEGLEVTEDGLVVRLTAPYPQFEGLLTQPWSYLVPREAVRRYGSGFGQRPIGTGPFRLDRVDELGTIRFVRFEGYRLKGLPHLAEVRFENVPEPDLRAQRFRAGDLQVEYLWEGNRREWLDENGRLDARWRNRGYRVTDGPALAITYVTINHLHAFLKKPGVREALALATDRRAFAKAILGNPDFAWGAPVPPGLPEAQAIEELEDPHAKPDFAAAAEALAKAGHPKGKGLPTLVMDVPGLQPNTAYARAVDRLIAEWARIGVTVELRAGDFATWQQRVRRGDMQMALVRWFADYPDCENFLGLFRSAAEGDELSSNYGRFSDKAYDAMYDRFAVMRSGPARTRLVAEMVQHLRGRTPWIFLAAPREQLLLGPGVGYFRHNLLNHTLRDVRFTPRKQRR